MKSISFDQLPVLAVAGDEVFSVAASATLLEIADLLHDNDVGALVVGHEQVAGIVAPSKVVAVALNTSLFADDDDARRVIAETAAETGLPADDPVRFGPDRLWSEIRRGVDALPWVAEA